MTGPTQAKRAALGRSFAASSASLRVTAVLGLAAMALVGCSNFGNRQGTYTCPQAQTVPDLQSLVQLPPGSTGQSNSAIISAGRVNTVTTTCDREGDSGVISTVVIEFTGLRTSPAVPHLDLPYFIAVADSDGNILGKQQFTVGMDFKPDTPVAKSTDSVNVHLPLKSAQLGNVYTLVIGFQLNPAQLAYNRAHLQ